MGAGSKREPATVTRRPESLGFALMTLGFKDQRLLVLDWHLHGLMRFDIFIGLA